MKKPKTPDVISMARMSFDSVVDRVFLTLIIGLGAYAATELRELSDSISFLSKTVASLDVREQQSQERIKELLQKIEVLDVRIRAVEIISGQNK
jgi:prefoldin subunit 5